MTGPFSRCGLFSVCPLRWSCWCGLIRIVSSVIFPVHRGPLWLDAAGSHQTMFLHPLPLLAGGSSDKMHDSKRKQSKITPQEQPHPDEQISTLSREVSGSAVFRNRRPDLCGVGPKQGVPRVGRMDETVLQREAFRHGGLQ